MLNMWVPMGRQPLRAPSELSMRPEPRLNVSANLEGDRMMSGRKTKMEATRKRNPVPAKTAK